jgi:hypothetical protein
MRSRLYASIALVVGFGIPASTDIVRADDPIAALNRSIQDRFQDIDKLFGLRRIVVLEDTPHRFRPDSVSEFSAVRELNDARLSVALYLAGRRVLQREPDLTASEPFAINRRVIFGPVHVTSVSASGLPAALDLLDESRVAFRTLARDHKHDFELADWKFTARAIRATGAQCLTCHRGLNVGDPLGVVLYAYRPSE